MRFLRERAGKLMGVMGNVSMMRRVKIFQDFINCLKNHDLNTNESLFLIVCGFKNHCALETEKEKTKLEKYFLLMTVLRRDNELYRKEYFLFFFSRNF